MNLTTVFFDLDGTLLPMKQENFIKGYSTALTAYLMNYGYDASVMRVIMEGTRDMVRNDGSRTNEEVFWARMRSVYGERVLGDIPVLERFYCEEFHSVSASCGYTPEARVLIDGLKAKGYRLVLATNPLFPELATHARLQWAGLSPSDFCYISVYENSRYAKPSLAYYRELLEKLALDPLECMMVGNDVDEDMIAGDLGMRTFLLTDDLINRSGKDLSSFEKGTFQDLKAYFQVQ